MLGYYNYTVLLTYVGVFSGFLGITYIARENVPMSLLCLMMAGVCVLFDGRIASTMERTRQEKQFGIQIDSLSDLVSSGVLPSLIVYQWADGSFFPLASGALYLLSALIRLAWFNVDEADRQNREEAPRAAYLGLPVTTVALILPLFMGLGQLLDLPADKAVSWLLLVMSLAFLLPFRIKKPEAAGKIALLLLGSVGFILALIGAIV